MLILLRRLSQLIAVVLLLDPFTAFAQITGDAPVAGRPAAIINLTTDAGVKLLKGQWRYKDVNIVEVEHHSVGPDLRPSGPPNRTRDITPQAGAADFDDSQWEALAPAQLEARKSTGRFCFNWYRINVTVPAKVDGKHLATIKGPEHPHNLAWGDDDGKALYLTAQTSIYRIRLNIPGIRPEVRFRDVG